MTDSNRRRSDTSVIAIAAVTAGDMVAATGHGLVATVVTTAQCRRFGRGAVLDSRGLKHVCHPIRSVQVVANRS